MDSDSARPTETSESAEKSRRALLKIAAAGVGGAAVAIAAGSSPASAANGNSIIIGQDNTGTSATELDTTGTLSGAQVLFQSGNTYTADSSDFNAALAGWASATGQSNVGVYAYSEVSGGASLGIESFGGAVDVRFNSFSTSAPTSGSHQFGDILAADDGLWICIAGGSPGTWRRIAGTGSAGAFNAINPHRVYNSLHSTKLTSGTTRTVSVANGINASGAVDVANLVPAGATAIAVNITITSTTGSGYLTLFPGGAARPTAGAITWFGSGQTLANGIQLAISSSRTVSIYCGGGGSTQVLLDVNGYYL